MRKKTLAFIIPSLSSGGAERVVCNLANKLVQEFEVVIINFDVNIPFYPIDSRVKLRYCKDKILPSKNSWESLKLNYSLFKKISAIFKAENVDVPIGFMTSSNILTILAARANNLPAIISERIDPAHAETPLIWRHIKKWVYPKTDFLIVQTEQIKSFFLNTVSDEKLVILPNPLSKELVPNSKENSQKRNIVLNVGRLTNQKGQDILINAFAKLNPPEWELVIVGEGPNYDSYLRQIRTQNMENKIFLVGKTKNISDFYNKAKIFAFPSNFEGFPNALIEAMHMGLACISTDCPTGPSELIDDGENGYLIEVRDQNALEERLNILMNDKDLIERFSELAKTSVQKYSIDHVIKSWKKVILLASKNRS